MISFHGDEAIKEKYLARVIKRRELDNIIQGIGWKKGKGCAVGCTLENYNHTQYPIELGLPEWLAHLEDAIFEGLPLEEAKTWPERFLSIIPLGIDVENVKHKLSIKRLNRLIEIQQKLSKKNESLAETFIKVISSIEIIKKCHEAEINNNYCDWYAAQAVAQVVAQYIAQAVRSARYAAAWPVVQAVRSAGLSARAAGWSADLHDRSAARSADSAAWSAAEHAAGCVTSAAESERSAAWKQESEDLLSLLSECK